MLVARNCDAVVNYGVALPLSQLLPWAATVNFKMGGDQTVSFDNCQAAIRKFRHPVKIPGPKYES